MWILGHEGLKKLLKGEVSRISLEYYLQRIYQHALCRGADPGVFYWLGGGEGGGGPNLGSEITVELFCGKLLLTETTMCFSICELRSPLLREILLREQRRTDHRRVPKHNYIF